MPATAQASASISILWAAPFALLLLSIAVLPLVRKHWWEYNYPYIALVLGLIASGYYFFGSGPMARWLAGMEEYASFIVLLAALFVISGGIVIKVTRTATPMVNAVLLLIGAVVANLFGTTGAAMLLIRPYLRMNRAHLKPYHVVFFIFIVANAGGCLTPIGDPPLFIGYLMGVPFEWVPQHMHRIWMFVIALLLLVFVIIDKRDHAGEARQRHDDGGPQVQISGMQNVVFIMLVTAAVFRPGFFAALHGPMNATKALSLFVSRELLMIAAAVASWLLTSRKIYRHNEFNFAPIREVAILFAGIFATMVPAIQYMQANASRMPVKTPTQLYFAGGMLSSLLDNAPTYKTFVDTRLGQLDPSDVEVARAEITRMASKQNQVISPDLPPGPVRGAVEAIVRYHAAEVASGTVTDEEVKVAFLLGTPAWNMLLVAISAASVLWGACTYIGNGPNLMIKSIADAAGVRTPGFFAYVYRYALPILVPIYLLVWLIFIRG